MVTPNDGAIEFENLTLNLGTETKEFTDTELIPNANQTDNIFVQVPAGFVVTDLVISGSSADVSGGVTDQSLFNLGSVCEGTGFGSLAVNKVVTHPGANIISGTFSATVVCMLDSTVAKSQSLSLVRDGAAQKVSDIPAGSTCTVTETGVSSAVGISYTPNASVVVNKNDAKSVTITNDYVNVLAAIVKQPNFTG